MMFVTISSAGAGRAWISAVTPGVTSSADIEPVRSRFRAGGEVPNATWVNVALSHTGLAALDRPDDELRAFPRAFRAGMAARAQRVGD